jgi:TetR/AcrR family transcriptional regulator, cholesterol catabolism regulator
VLRDIYLGALYRWFREADAEPNGKLQQELLQALELLLSGTTGRG